MTTLLASLVIFLIVVTAMSVGVIISGKRLTRGCGTPITSKRGSKSNPSTSPCDYCDKKDRC